MTLVVDASVAFKWLVEEAGSAEAEALLARGDSLVAPDLVLVEVANALWCKVGRGEVSGEQAVLALDRLGVFFDALIPDQRLAPRALDIAFRLRHPVYDCLYLACAEAADGVLATADRRLGEAVAGTAFAGSVHALAASPP